VLAFDREGRPLFWFRRGRVFKRSLASEVFARERQAGRKQYWQLSEDEAADQFAWIARTVADVSVGAADRDRIERRDEILAWTPERLLAERRRFDAAYRPIAILPPDQYLSIVLQASFGCSWNRCTFCSFYQDRPFSVREPEEFREHGVRVQELLGRAAGLRRRVFLADGNALTLSNRRLLPLMELARAAFPGRGLYGFVDVFSGEKKSIDEWIELRRAGLHRVYVGVETGDDELLSRLNKPGSADEACGFVQTLRTAGLGVSVIFMVGIGGREHADAHVRHTLDLIARLPLAGKDVVYLSPFQDPERSEETESEAQYVELRDGIRRALPGIRVTRYDIREFIY
jgi:radical SAM superfamily enzyme YgiQ (UPF0313 family)